MLQSSSSATITKTLDKSEVVFAAIKEITKYEIKIGYPKEYKTREVMASDELRRNGVHLTNPQIAYIEEYGDTKLNIPPRPSLVPGVQAAMPQIVRQLGPALRKAINSQSPKDELIIMGRTGRNSVRNYILNGVHKPLAPRTIQLRQRAGITLTIPLIETGRMRNALSYMVDYMGSRIFLSDKLREIKPSAPVALTRKVGLNVLP